MEHISTIQLEKYRDILAQIDNEHAKFKELKKAVDSETNKLTAMRITTQEGFTKENMFHVLVKIFSSDFEIIDFLDCKTSDIHCDDLTEFRNHKFYLIEIYSQESFLNKIVNKWMVNVCIRNNEYCVNKTVFLKKKIASPIKIIVPFSTSITDSEVEVNLLLKLKDISQIINIAVIPIGISYHLKTPSLRKIRKTSQNENVINILQKYQNKIPKFVAQLHPIEYKFVSRCVAKNFLELIARNCYHQLDIGLLEAISGSGETIECEFATEDENDVKVILDKTCNTVIIKSDLNNVYRLKKYFINEFKDADITLSKTCITQLINLVSYLHTGLAEYNIDPENLCIIYNELRKIIFTFPI